VLLRVFSFIIGCWSLMVGNHAEVRRYQGLAKMASGFSVCAWATMFKTQLGPLNYKNANDKGAHG
jgi:hypothetical protein